jgi:hypothetical protein
MSTATKASAKSLPARAGVPDSTAIETRLDPVSWDCITVHSGMPQGICPVNHNFPICRAATYVGNEQNTGGNMPRPRAADDFPAIRARMEELRRESAHVPPADDPRRATAPPRPDAIRSRPGLADGSGLSPVIRRAFLKVRTA